MVPFMVWLAGIDVVTGPTVVAAEAAEEDWAGGGEALTPREAQSAVPT
jgi:hypothetical protein